MIPPLDIRWSELKLPWARQSRTEEEIFEEKKEKEKVEAKYCTRLYLESDQTKAGINDIRSILMSHNVHNVTSCHLISTTYAPSSRV